MLPKISILLFSLHYLSAQQDSLYFPDDNDEISASIGYRAEAATIPALAPSFSTLVPPNVNLTKIRGTALYESYVENIISKGVTKLALAINKVLLNDDVIKNGNVIVSPMSIAGALALVLLGSNGKTFEEISTVLGLTSGVEIQMKSLQVHQQFSRIVEKLHATSGLRLGTEVTFASAVFIENNFPIRNVYKQTAEDLYKSEILNMEFERNPALAQKIINAWVSERTNGKIPEILSDAPSQDTKVIIASAMYFKAGWAQPFFQGTTRRRPFYENGRKLPTNIEAEMMSNGGFFPYYKDRALKCEILGLPYKGNNSVMYIVIPFDSNKQKLRQFEENFTPEQLERLVENTVSTGAVVLFPKMRIESTVDLKHSLEVLGLKSLFDPVDSNLALLSPGSDRSILNNPKILSSVVKNPLVSQDSEDDSILIFNRLGEKVNCSSVFNPKGNLSTCNETSTDTKVNKPVSSKRFSTKIRPNINQRSGAIFGPNQETVDNIRQLINQQSTSNNYQNPGLYANKVVHKVFMDITETGTEAAAVTSVSLSRDGSRVTFRVDVPFLFFIRHETTKTMLFWGSITTPTPNFATH